MALSLGGGPPLGRGVSCGAVAGQVKGDTVHIEKSFQKYLGNSKRSGEWMCNRELGVLTVVRAALTGQFILRMISNTSLQLKRVLRPT